MKRLAKISNAVSIPNKIINLPIRSANFFSFFNIFPETPAKNVTFSFFQILIPKNIKKLLNKIPYKSFIIMNLSILCFITDPLQNIVTLFQGSSNAKSSCSFEKSLIKNSLQTNILLQLKKHPFRKKID